MSSGYAFSWDTRGRLDEETAATATELVAEWLRDREQVDGEAVPDIEFTERPTDDGSGVKVLAYVGWDWALFAAQDGDLTEALAEVGVFAEPVQGNELGLYEE